MTVLDKSRADWGQYKKADETVQEELQAHGRSADQARPPLAGERFFSLLPPLLPPTGLRNAPCPLAFGTRPLTGARPPAPAQYLERQAFLKSAELRQYEQERDARLGSDIRNRGRL